MTQKDPRQIQEELAMPFAPEDLEWRLQRTFEYQGETKGIAVAYVTNRAIMTRLDSVVGPENWYNEFKPWHGPTRRSPSFAASRSTTRAAASSPNGTARKIPILSPSRGACPTA